MTTRVSNVIHDTTHDNLIRELSIESGVNSFKMSSSDESLDMSYDSYRERYDISKTLTSKKEIVMYGIPPDTTDEVMLRYLNKIRIENKVFFDKKGKELNGLIYYAKKTKKQKQFDSEQSENEENIITEISQKIGEKAKQELNRCGLSKISMNAFIFNRANKWYAAIKLIEILVSVYSSIWYVNFAAFRYDVDKDSQDSEHWLHELAPNNYPTDEEIKQYNKIQIGFESFFLMIMISEFFVQYEDLQQSVIIRDFYKIAQRYIYEGNFFTDVLMLIQWNFFVHFRGSRYLFLIKTYRLFKTFKLLDPKIIMYRIQGIHQIEMEKLSKNPETANDVQKDHIRIVYLIFTKYILLIVKIGVQISLVTYFTGNIFYILIDLADGLELDQEYEESDNANIISAFGLYKLRHHDKSIAMTYWCFTTLSTVGFGDIHPKSNFERICTAELMLIGVLVFSIVRDRLIGIIDFTIHIDEDFDDGIELTRFLGVIKRFNNNMDMDSKLQKQIVDFFIYKWENDKNLALDLENDKILSELPIQCQRKLYLDFLNQEFWIKFKSYFTFPCFDYKYKHSYQNLETHEHYGNFIVSVLQNLEPICFQPKQTIMSELETVDQVTFISSGSYDIGYEINKIESMKLRRFAGSIIGMFEITFNRRCQFIYRAHRKTGGYFIRKKNWHAIGERHPDHFKFLTKRAFIDHFTNLARKMLEFRQIEIQKYERRNDYHQVVVMKDLLADEVKNLLRKKLIETSQGSGQDEQEWMMPFLEQFSSMFDKARVPFEGYIDRMVMRHHDLLHHIQNCNAASYDLKSQNRKLKYALGLDYDQQSTQFKSLQPKAFSESMLFGPQREDSNSFVAATRKLNQPNIFTGGTQSPIPDQLDTIYYDAQTIEVDAIIDIRKSQEKEEDAILAEVEPQLLNPLQIMNMEQKPRVSKKKRKYSESKDQIHELLYEISEKSGVKQFKKNQKKKKK